MHSKTKALKHSNTISELFIILGFITFYLPADYAVPRAIYLLWKYSYAVVVIFSCLTLFVSRKINTRNTTMFVYYFWIFIAASIISGIRIRPLGAVQCAGCIAYMEYLFQTRSERSVLRTYLIAGLIMSCVHFASFIKYGDVVGGMLQDAGGGQNWYFLKHDNGSIYYFIPIIVMLFYYSIFHNKKAFKYFLAYAAFILYMFIYKMAATAMVVSVFMVASLLYMYIRRKKKHPLPYSLFNYKSAIIIGFASEIVPMIIAGGAMAISITSFLGKSSSFGRISIWVNSLYYILQNPIAGLGIEEDIVTTMKIGINHCHNLIVQNLYMGGIIAMFLFIMILVRYRPKRTNQFKTAIFSVGIIGFFVTASMDWYFYYPLPMSLFIFNYYINMRDKSAKK